jgi:hypothetical protein
MLVPRRQFVRRGSAEAQNVGVSCHLQYETFHRKSQVYSYILIILSVKGDLIFEFSLRYTTTRRTQHCGGLVA